MAPVEQGSPDRSAGGALEIPSPNPSSASCASASSTSFASGPEALTNSLSPNLAPSATMFVRLVAFTGTPSGALATRTSASKPRTVWTKRAAGRACRPIALRTSSAVCASAGDDDGGSLTGASGSETPSWAVFIASAPRASAATSSSAAPPRAATAAATVPSTSGASLNTTRPGGSSSNSTASSALISALPRSISTRTPSEDMARSIAARTRSASVPSTPGSSVPPAASSARSVPPISRASATTP